MHHLTHIENLEKIIKDGFLKSRNFMDSKFTDTANQSIINSRSNVNGKNLNNYVPFHWNNFQKDYKIPYNTDVLGRVGCENMIFLSGKIPEFSTNLYFLFHPTSQYKKEYTDFDKYLEYLTKEHGFLQKEAYLKNPWWELDFSDNKVKQFLMS
ncbi:MAG: DarT ssDNA thymidine ADP-ribosyltransferase family protein, partial [Cetobacterium sp.]